MGGDADLHAEASGQVHARRPAQLLHHHADRSGAAPLHGGHALADPIVAAQPPQLLHHPRIAAGQAEAVWNGIHSGGRHLHGRQGAQRLVNALAVRCVAGIVDAEQRLAHGVPLRVGDAVGANPQGQGVAAVAVNAGAAEEDGVVPGQVAQHPGAAGVREQADGHFGIGHPGALRQHPEAAAGKDAQAAAHHHPVAHANGRLGQSVDEVVHAVFVGEEVEGIAIDRLPGGLVFDDGAVQRLYVPPSAKGAVSSAGEQHRRHALVPAPRLERRDENSRHLQAEGVQGRLGVQLGLRDDTPAADLMLPERHAGACFIQTAHALQPLTHCGGRFSRKALTPSFWSRVSNRPTKASRSAL